jgi:hypothetical protein
LTIAGAAVSTTPISSIGESTQLTYRQGVVDGANAWGQNPRKRMSMMSVFLECATMCANNASHT